MTSFHLLRSLHTHFASSTVIKFLIHARLTIRDLKMHSQFSYQYSKTIYFSRRHHFKTCILIFPMNVVKGHLF
jgi:hypothetical protein